MREDEFAERATREGVRRLILRTMRSGPFLEAVRGAGWLTLDGVVVALDEADYWKGRGWANLEPPEEPPLTPAGKRKHVREMIEHLSPDFGGEPTTEGLDKMLATTFKATNEGGIERHFKVLDELTRGELMDVAEGHLASSDYHSVRGREAYDAAAALRRGEEIPASELYLSDLTEATMLRAWPGLGDAERVEVVSLGMKAHDVMREIIEAAVREHEAGRLPSVEQHEAFVAGRIADMWRALARHLADRTGRPLSEAEEFLVDPLLRTYVTEFSEALGNLEGSYEWTLDEHLGFVLDERELRELG